MTIFRVQVREVHVQGVVVEAEDGTQAIEKVASGEGCYENDAIEYSHTMETSTWTVGPALGVKELDANGDPIYNYPDSHITGDAFGEKSEDE